MEQYKVKKDGFKEIKKKILIRTIPLMLIAAAGGIYISTVNANGSPSDINIMPYFIPLIAIVLGFSIYKGLNRQKELFESFMLSISNDIVTREQFNTPVISIRFNDVKEITKIKNGNFVIKGREVSDIIIIPVQIENYAQLEATLAQIKPLAFKENKSFLEKNSIILSLATVGLMLCVYTVTNKIAVAASGVLLIGIMLWSFYEIRRNKNIDNKTKRGMWFVLLVVVSVLVMMINKLKS